jgi:hypothetical protein
MHRPVWYTPHYMTMRNTLLAVVAVAVLAAGGWFVYATSNTTPTAADEFAVRALVTEFGTKLQMVPLLAETPVRKVAMEQYYGPYVAPELIAQWIPEGAEGALGRYTSSPWPERIEIVEVRPTGKNFVVEGNVIEVTSSQGSGQGSIEAGAGKAAAAVYPVTLAVEKRDGVWKIVKAEKGAYSELPQHRAVVGFWECLPHKDSNDTSKECQLGIALDQSDGHLALNLNLMSRAPVQYPRGTKVRVEGVVTPANQLSSDHWQQYDIDGIISATSIEEI